MSDSLWPHGLQHTSLPCPSLSPRVCSNSCPLSWWRHPIISFSVMPFSCLQSSPTSAPFPNESALHIRWTKDWSFTFSISLSNEYSGFISFRADLFYLLAVQWTLKSFLQHHSSRVSSAVFFSSQPSLWSNSHIHTWLLKRNIVLTIQTFVSKVTALLFNMLSRFVIVLLSRSKCLLIPLLQEPSTVILEPKKIKSVTVSIALPSICHEVVRPDAMIVVIWILNFKSAFFTLHFHLHKEAL